MSSCNSYPPCLIFAHILIIVLDKSFGIPPEMKSWLQEEALEYMGENKASYLTKAAIDKIPEGDQKVWRFWPSTTQEIQNTDLATRNSSKPATRSKISVAER
jgi:hypothetical protein